MNVTAQTTNKPKPEKQIREPDSLRTGAITDAAATKRQFSFAQKMNVFPGCICVTAKNPSSSLSPLFSRWRHFHAIRLCLKSRGFNFRQG